MRFQKIFRSFLDFAKKLKFLDYLIVLAVILFGVILYKFFNPEQSWISVVILDEKIPIYQVSTVNVNDFEKDPNGKKIAEVSKIELFDSPNTASSKDLFISAKLLVKINPRSKEYEYKNKIIKVGSPIEVRLNNYLVTGILANIGGGRIGEEIVTKVLTLKIYEEWSWYADSIKVGDSELDENGEKLVEVLSKEVVPAEITINTASGERLLKTDPRKVDVTLKVKVRAQKFSNQVVFRKDKRLLIGELFTFNANKTRVRDASIIDME